MENKKIIEIINKIIKDCAEYTNYKIMPVAFYIEGKGIIYLNGLEKLENINNEDNGVLNITFSLN